MFPRTIRQNKKIKQLFYSQLSISNAKKQKTMSDDDIMKMNANIKKGELGEKKSRRELKLFLPKDCIIMNDVVLEITPNHFNQFDHLILSPKGIYIVDTKNWNFEWELSNNNSEWTSEQTNVRNPNTQKIYHKKNFILWLEDHFKEYDKVTPFINSKIILLGKVNKNYGDEDTVIKPKHIADKIKVFAAKRNIPQDTLIRLADCIKNAKPLNHWEWIFNHYEIKDERKIFVDASFDETLKIKSIYEDKGFQTTKIKKYGYNKYCFEVTNHIELLEDNISLAKKLQNIRTQKNERIPYHLKCIKTVCLFLIIGYLLNTALIQFPILVDKINISNASKANIIADNVSTNKINERIKFTVNKNISYIFIKDGETIVFNNAKTKKGTEITFLDNKTIIINEIEKEPIKYTCDNDIIKFEVGNNHTKIILNDKEYNVRSKIVKYSFSENKIID